MGGSMFENMTDMTNMTKMTDITNMIDMTKPTDMTNKPLVKKFCSPQKIPRSLHTLPEGHCDPYHYPSGTM